MTDFAIRTENLTRYFGAKRAVCALDLAVPKGTIFGFLGRNGSGKTTTIRMLLGLLEPTRGRATVLGEDTRRLSPATRARIGYLSEGHYLPPWMRVRQCGKFQAQCFRTWNEDLFQSVLKHFRIDPNARAKALSRGERAGVCIALTLAPGPELLILDDPALGLDPVVRRGLLESMLYVTRREGRTILFSSHMLSDVERVAEHVAIVDRGVLRAQCKLDTLAAHIRRILLRFKSEPPALPEIPGLLNVQRFPNELSLSIANFCDATQKILDALPVESSTTMPTTLEEAFIDYAGERGEKSFFLERMGGAA